MDLGIGSPAPAVRTRTPGWRDPRLWIGIVLVAASVVLGARLLASSDDTVGVWAARTDLPAGASIGADDVVVEQVRMPDSGGLASYLSAEEPIADGTTVLRTIGAGELVPRAAVGERSSTVEVPVAVAPDQVPGSVSAGSVVDVYLLVAARSSGPALSGVTVIDASLPEEELAVSGTRRLVLAVPQEQAAGFLAALGRQDAPRVTVVRRG